MGQNTCKRLLLATTLALCIGPWLDRAALADVFITEWMYSPGGSVGEFVEFTNLGASAVDFAGWSYDDDSRTPGSENLSAFGVVAPGESVVITEASAADFRAEWDLAPTVKVIGGITNNLGRNDEINLYDASNTLVDRLSFGDQSFPGTIRTQGKSGRPSSLAALGADNPALWVLSAVGDVEGSYLSIGGDIGSPGKTSFSAAVPEPSGYGVILIGLGLLSAVLRRNRRA